ncbi:MAG: NAD(P)H-hydrate dehydratase [Candidatus Thermoplasmatota archaeon]
MLNAKEIHVLDRNAEYFGVPTSQLMENAGKAVAEFIALKFKLDHKKILIFCGSGNNGGDGLVAARYLHEQHAKVSVFLAADEMKTDISQVNYTKVKQLGIRIYTLDDFNQVDDLIRDHELLVDALLGIGVEGILREPYSILVHKINSSHDKTIISVDVPTGFGTNLSVKPHFTITFHDMKEGMNHENSGYIHVSDIGIPLQAVQYVGPGDVSVYYPRPKKQSHKGENGVVLIIGGGPYTGAPALAGLACLRTGADLVYIATPQRSWSIVASFSPNLIVQDLSDEYLKEQDISKIKQFLPHCTAVLLGPGLGSKHETENAIYQLLKLCVAEQKPLVVDADAISVVGKHRDILKNTSTVVTPHAGEFQKLTGVELPVDVMTRVKIVDEWARTLGITVFLKGPIDILSNGFDHKQNIVHNEAMTVGGTGDVLAGIISCLLAKGVQPFHAVRIAAFLNGEAGNLAFKKKSYGLLATDIIDEIPEVLKKYL